MSSQDDHAATEIQQLQMMAMTKSCNEAKDCELISKAACNGNHHAAIESVA
jgi:hypothetical protein